MALVGAHCRHTERHEGQGWSVCCIQCHTEHSCTLLDTVSISCICNIRPGHKFSLIFNLNYSYSVINNVSGLKPQEQGSNTRKYVVTGRNLKQNRVVLRVGVLPGTSSSFKLSLNRKKGCSPHKVHIQSASGGEVMAVTPPGDAGVN